MKAEIVHNNAGEPRVMLTFESDAERALFEGGPDLVPCVEMRTGGGEGELRAWSFTIEQRSTAVMRVGEW